MQDLRPLLLITLLAAIFSPQARAQSSPHASPQNFASTSAGTTGISPVKLPEAPGPHIAVSGSQPQQSETRANGCISGTVLDSNGAEVTGATVYLENVESRLQRTLTTDDSGAFSFASIEPGRFTIAISAPGFTRWQSSEITLQPDEYYDLPQVALEVAEAMTDVEVTASRHDIAEEQMQLAEKQRVLAVFPNFYVSYLWNAAPLSSGQKFRLASRTMIDPVSFVIPAVIAGVEQSQNGFSGYGQGGKGYAKRFAASYGDSFISTMIGGAILPSVLRQDPRYFYKGTGSIRSRALYAIATVVICKGDNGRWQPNYSNVFGNLASAGLSNLYYPASNRQGVGLTIDNWLIGTASGAASSLLQEFVIRKISHGVPPEPRTKTHPEAKSGN
jgi:Carboxypeptidase regulatory-like domain